MSIFKVNIIARNIKDESLVSPPVEVLVDTRSELTWLPKDLLTSIGVQPVRKRSFTTATKQMVTREIGYAIVSAEGFETVDEVVLAEAGDMSLLGVRTFGGFWSYGRQHCSPLCRNYDDSGSGPFTLRRKDPTYGRL